MTDRVKEMWVLTRPSVGLRWVVVSRFANTAIPVGSSTMRPNSIAMCKRLLKCRTNVDVVKVEAAVSLEINSRHLLNTINNSPSASNLLFPGHCWPYLMQLNTFDVFHNNVLAPDSVRRVVTPFKNCWYGDRRVGLY